MNTCHSARAFDKKVGALAGIPRRDEEVIEPASELCDTLFQERNGKHAILDAYSVICVEALSSLGNYMENSTDLISSAGSPPTARNSMP